MAKLPCNHEYQAASMACNGLNVTEFVEVKVAIQGMIYDLKSCADNDTTYNLFTCPPSTWVVPTDTKSPPSTQTPMHHHDK
eukprot:12341340-Ditylum_brightwellii.AAC.1